MNDSVGRLSIICVVCDSKKKNIAIGNSHTENHSNLETTPLEYAETFLKNRKL